MNTPYYEPDLTTITKAIPKYPRFILKMAYEYFSESEYAAGWMSLDDKLLNQFKSWLLLQELEDVNEESTE